MKQHIWKVREITKEAYHSAKQYSISVFISQVLLNRGIRQEEFKNFLNPSFEDFHSPFLLPDIEKAVSRIKKAAKNCEKALVFGDYDVDGITSLAIFNEYSKRFPGLFCFYIPHRVNEGYGLSREAILQAKEDSVSLIICFDCGSNADSEIELAKSFGIDVIVIDHHHLSQESIKPFAFVNPKRSSSLYPFSDLSAGSLSFKVLQALIGQEAIGVLDLVVLSVVCDVVPLCGENRALLKKGIEAIRISERPAIKALCTVSGIKQANIDTFHIGYILGPRINASGRVAHANDSLALFLADNIKDAEQLARQLTDYNKLRKNIETQILKEAEQKLIDSASDDNAIVVSGQKWHPGVLGIVASRLADKYGKPAFVISFDKGKGVGSARSIDGVHLIEALDGCADTLLTYGGHKKAAGVHIQEEELDNFKEKINLFIEKDLKGQDFTPVIAIDAEMSFKDINTDLAKAVECLAPHGEANPKPLFMAPAVYKKSKPRKISFGYSVWLSDGIMTFEGTFYSKDLMDVFLSQDTLDIVFSLQFNSYHRAPRLAIKYCRIPGNN
jgi:single-stranded-DNA-specific exonuclease